MDFDILYDDKQIVVCVKPQGIISQSDDNKQQNMVSLLEKALTTKIYPVHRLDKETGGVMVFAKNSNAAAKLSRDITEHKLEKEYLAVTHNKVNPSSNELVDLLFYDRQRNKSYVVKRERKGVKKAVLDYVLQSVFEINDAVYSLVKIKLKTGRTHQIRIQFASRGYPLLGDRKYGALDDVRNLGLWAYKLSFFHPKTLQRLEFYSQPKGQAFSSLNL